MFKEVIGWDIYEIQSESTPINGVMLRGRIRKFCLEKNRNVLVENTQDIGKSVRYAIPHREDPSDINEYLTSLITDIKIELAKEDIKNPVLSKLKVNLEDRYTL